MGRNFLIFLGVALSAFGIIGFLSSDQSSETILLIANRKQNALHFGTGILALIAAFYGSKSIRLYLLSAGIFYGLIALGGFAAWRSLITFFELTRTGDVLHAVIAAACLYMYQSVRSGATP